AEVALSRAGYTVLGASDGEEGLRIATERVPDVVVLDMMLPKMSGPQLLQALKSNPATARVPVIVMTSLPQSNEKRLKSEGAAAYLEKSKLNVETGSASLIQVVGEVLSPRSAAAKAQ